MRKWLYQTARDDRALNRRLDRLAACGWELEHLDGFFTGTFRRTDRTDLRYLSVSLDRRHNWEVLSRACAVCGWEPVGVYHGMGVFCSKPCRECDRERTLRELALLGVGRTSVGALLRLLFCAIAGIALAGFGVFYLPSLPALRQEAWYLSHTGVLLHLLLPAWLALCTAALLLPGVHWLISRRSTPVLALAQGVITLMVFTLPLLCLPVALLDLSASALLFFCLGIGVAAALFTGTWQTNARWYGTALAGCALCVTLLGMVFPNAERADFQGAVWRRTLPWCLRLDELADRTDVLVGAEYERDGSLLVRRISYEELWTDGGVSSEVYRCANRAIRNRVLAEQLSAGDWLPGEDGRWESGDGTELLLARDNTVAVLDGTVDWDSWTAQRLWELLAGDTG